MRGYDPEDARRALRAYLATKKERLAPWCQRAGISESAVRGFLRGRSQSLSGRTLERLAQADGVEIGRLLPGAGALDQRPLVTAELADGPGVALLGAVFVRVWVRDADAPGFELLRRDRLAALTTARPDQLVLLPVRTDAMADTLNPGDTALVDTTRTDPREAGVFAVTVDGTPAIRRLTYDWADGRVLVSHDNPAYAPFPATPEAVPILGRVIWAGRAFA